MSQFDIVVFGATSFVGQLVTEYLLQRCPPDSGVRWAIAGRSATKLETLRERLNIDREAVPSIIADAAEQASLEAMCQSTRLVVSTVGPYALYGEELVKVCASQGTDYCDLTGEPQWIHKMLTRYEAVAKLSGARLVHCCGFDSIPSDLGVYMLQQHARETLQSPCEQIRMRVTKLKGAASGGTVASMVNLMKEVSSNPSLRRVLTNPYALCPADHGFSVRQENLKAAKFDQELQTWIAPFVMAAINTRIVHRSNALLHNAYGNNFRYDEALVMGDSAKGSIKATAMSVGLGGFMLAAAIPPTRWLLEQLILPKPGEGPNAEARHKGHYQMDFYGNTPDGRQVHGVVTGDRDPGYGSTAKMLSEAALCLAFDIPATLRGGGFWTPATAMGDALIPRLQQHAGMTFTIN